MAGLAEVFCGNGKAARRPRLLFAWYHYYVDPSSGAAISTRDLLDLLVARGWNCRVLCGPALDFEGGESIPQLLSDQQLSFQQRHTEAGPIPFSLYHFRQNGVPASIYAPWRTEGRIPAAEEGAAFLALFEPLELRTPPSESVAALIGLGGALGALNSRVGPQTRLNPGHTDDILLGNAPVGSQGIVSAFESRGLPPLVLPPVPESGQRPAPARPTSPAHAPEGRLLDELLALPLEKPDRPQAADSLLSSDLPFALAPLLKHAAMEAALGGTVGSLPGDLPAPTATGEPSGGTAANAAPTGSADAPPPRAHGVITPLRFDTPPASHFAGIGAKEKPGLSPMTEGSGGSGGNHPPVASDDSGGGPAVYETLFEVPAGDPPGSYYPNILANDYDEDGDDLEVSAVTDGPDHGTLDMDPDEDGILDGSFEYTPDDGYTGQDEFRYKATDGIDESEEEARVYLEVVRPIVDIDTAFDGAAGSGGSGGGDPDEYEDEAPGNIITYNDDDDNASGVPDREEGAPFQTPGGGPATDDDLESATLNYDEEGADLEGFSFSFAQSGATLKVWDTTDKQHELTAVAFTVEEDAVARATVGGDELVLPGTVYVEGCTIGEADLSFVIENPAGHEINRDTVKFTVVKIDIDTDSDNDGDVQRSTFEESREDVNGSGMFEVGKRIFVNTDDDNENGEVDTSDTKSDYTDPDPEFHDNDFAEMVIDATGTESLTGHRLYLIADPYLNIWADDQRTPLAEAANPPGDSSGTDNDATDDVYWWTIGDDDFGSSRTLYVEGTETGERQVRWQLRKSEATILARDTIEINVEEIVYPFTNQPIENWYDLPTSDYWVGLNVAEAWHMDKTLVDYITTSGEKGQLETIHPDMDDPTTPGEQLTWSSKVGGLSTTTETYGSGFTMEFDYSFETTRGEGTWGYVRIDNNGSRPQKLSFVGNSGVKFGGQEVAILDVSSMVGLGGGLAAFDPGEDGYIQSNGNVDTAGEYTTEPLKKLMTGVIYDGDYAKMADNPDYPDQGIPDSAEEYFDTLENNYNRTNGHMKIDVTKVSGSTYTIAVYLDKEQDVCYSEDVTVTAFGTLDLQSHWGSGVIFSNMDISKKEP